MIFPSGLDSLLKSDRPVVTFDLETTGTDIQTAQIVELSLCRREPDGTQEAYTARVKPTIPIPADSTAIHGISDSDVENEPTFFDRAPKIARYFQGAIVCGYNVRKFDVPILAREMRRAGQQFEEPDLVIDVFEIFRALNPHSLETAIRWYLDREHTGAHGAEADTIGTIEVLEAMLKRHDLPRDAEQLAEHRPDPSYVDRDGKLRWKNNEVVFNFGKVAGKTLREVATYDAGFIRWMIGKDFPADVMAIVQDALRGKYPEPPK